MHVSRFSKFLISFAALALLALQAARAAPQVQIGYMPIIADSQTFVVAEGLTDRNPLAKARLVLFQSGPEIVQALLSGQLDVAYVGAGPAMVARAAGADVRFVAANMYGDARVLALGNFAPYFKNATPAQAIARFTKEKGRRPVITTFPIGSGPAASLRIWLRDQTKAGLDSVQIVYQGENQVVQSLLTGAVDGTVSPDPAMDIVMARQPDAKIVDLVPNSPGAGLLVRERLIQSNPEYVRELVRAQLQATQLLRDDPKSAAVAVQKHVGGGRLAMDIVLTSLSHLTYDADPRRLQRDAAKLYEFQTSVGVFKRKLEVSELFDARFYDELKGARP
ncbi:MAG: ABC transporter substrate-binding protein [Burkholderiaceae bacterium]